MKRIDIIGQNGNEGIHYDKPICFLSNPSYAEMDYNDCEHCPVNVECLLNILDSIFDAEGN